MAMQAGARGFSHDGLRPLWSRNGRQVAFDSTHGGQGWQVNIQHVL